MYKLSFFAVLLLLTVSMVLSQNVRPPKDDVGFCWNATQMERLVKYLQASMPATPAVHQPIIAGISPHDDFLYAARQYYPLFSALRTKEVVIFGVTHGTVRREIGDPHNVLILDSADAWTGIRGPVRISPLRKEIIAAFDTSTVLVSDRAHRLEHSIEALVPWLQYFNPGIRITPIMVTAMPFERMTDVADRLSAVIAAYIKRNNLQLGKDIAFLISTDANHYGHDFSNIPFGEDDAAHTKGTALDDSLARTTCAGTLTTEKVRQLFSVISGRTYADPGRTLWCGRYSVPFGLLATERVIQRTAGKELTGTLLRYSDTYTEGVMPLTRTGMGTTAVFSLKHWCGFFSMAYTFAQ